MQNAEIVAVITSRKEKRQLVQPIWNYVQLAEKRPLQERLLTSCQINKQQMQPKQRAHPSKTTQRKTVYVVGDNEISESSDDHS